jgi:transcriptional regulator with XRE-family HTH domain
MKRDQVPELTYEMKKVKLQAVLKKLIQQKSMTARQVARNCGIPQSTLNNFLSGRGPHRPEQIHQLASYFGVSMEFLLFGEDDRKPTLDDVLTEGIFEGWLKVKTMYESGHRLKGS